VYPKSIVNKVPSPDVGMEYSLNPYQGCEHGCVYCYARNTHPYWGYSAGLDFETKVMFKKNAPELLSKFLRHPKWEGHPIMLSGNTDCYQPIERKLEITRALLKVFWEFRHPTGIITKNSLVRRDIDLLKDLSENKLVKVAISLNTLNDTLRQKLEPRTASVQQRLKTMAFLAKEGVPVMVMIAPVIPGLNDHEIMEIVRTAALMGVSKAGYIIVRLNGDVAQIFTDWLGKNYKDRAEKVISKITACHGGQLNDSRFGTRMKGEGKIAKIIKDQFDLAVRMYLPESKEEQSNHSLYLRRKRPQLDLFNPDILGS
ncbi:MAG: PA0069 family radical SAM protein, partial [Saprospiraceae bacterium]|nr:PA0069 family radical SAM protein [Saprospiraceae bacterium]